MMNAYEGGSSITNTLEFFGTNKVPMVFQAESSECGLACLAMISGYYGHSYDLTFLRSTFNTNSQGSSLKDISDYAKNLQLVPRALKVEPDQLNLLQLPCILHWNMSHFVVLSSIRKKKYVIHDPAFGIRNISIDELDSSFTGVALELIPAHDFVKEDAQRKLKLKDFLKNTIGLKRAASTIIALSFILQALAVISPLFSQIVIDNIIQSHDTSLLVVIASGFLLLLIMETSVGLLRELFVIRLSNKINIQISSNLFRQLLHLNSNYFFSRNVADIVSRFSSLKNIRDALTTGFVAVILDGLMILLTFSAMIIYDSLLALISVVMVLIYAVFRTIYFPQTRIRTEESLISKAQENSHFMETIRSIETIKIHSGETRRLLQWQRLLSNALNSEIKVSNWDLSFRTFSNFIFGLENLIIITVSATKIIGGEMTVGMFFAFLAFKFRFGTSVNGLITTWFNFKMLDLHLERISDIAFSEPDKNKIKHVKHQMIKHNEKIAELIRVENLSFQFHQNSPYLFKNFSLSVVKGESIAIVGESGCGKSTLLKILLNLTTPSSGKITYFYPSTNKTNKLKISAVMQNEQLFSGTIFENIVGFNEEFDQKKVEICCKIACIHDDILNMPMAYNTLIGDVDHSLSGGQVQRIALARALFGDPDVLILDEATSHLDANNERKINENIKNLGMTCIFVAHRIETIQFADRKLDLTEYR